MLCTPDDLDVLGAVFFLLGFDNGHFGLKSFDWRLFSNLSLQCIRKNPPKLTRRYVYHPH